MRKKIIVGILLTLLGIAIYLVVGLSAPFWKTKTITNETVLKEQVASILKDKESGDRAQILETSESALLERIRLLSMAQEHIILSTFDMREGASTNDLISILFKKAEEGVKIDILVDGVSGALRIEEKEIFEVLAGHENVTMKFYNPINIFAPWKLMGRMHDKYVIVDDIGYILGGRNTFDYFLGNYIDEGKSLDCDVLIYNSNRSFDSSLYEVKDYFYQIWNSSSCSNFPGTKNQKSNDKISSFLNEHLTTLKQEKKYLFEHYDYTKTTKSTKGVHLLSNPIHEYQKEPVVFYQLTEIMRSSKEGIAIHTPYAVFDDYMIDTLKEITKHHSVKMMLNAVTNGDNIMASSDYIYHKDNVLSTGIEVYEFSGGISYHGKSVAIDHKYAIIGSYNFDLRSTYVDTELMLVINSEEVTNDLLEVMEDLEEKAVRVNADGTYQNGPIVLPEASTKQMRTWKIIGWVMKPFRILV